MFLVLREKLSLPTILLGNDFLSVSNSQIIYHKDKPVSLFINEQNVKCCKGMQNNFYFTECLKSNVPTLATPVPTLATPVPTLVTHPPTLATPPTTQSANVQIEPTFSIFPPGKPVSFQHFSAFVSSCSLENNMQAYRNERIVKNIFAAAV